MNIVINTIEKYLPDSKTCFVFPSQTAAGLWAQKICTMGIVRSVAAARFMAWDRFKEEIVEEKSMEPVTKVMRKLFTDALIRKNANSFKTKDNDSPDKNSFPLRSVIPPEYAKKGQVYASYIARFLPSLATLEKLTDFNDSGDPEIADFAVIKNEYEVFLKRFNLFEPS